MKEDQRFRKHERLRLRADFARVFEQRCSAADALLVVYVATNGLRWSRLGISVGKRVGNAIKRHYIRRCLREAFRTQKPSIPTGLDIVCIAKAGVLSRAGNIPDSVQRLAGIASRQLSERNADAQER